MTAELTSIKLEMLLNNASRLAWTIQGSAANREWRAIAWSPALGLFAAVASSGTGDRIQTSPDGINWTSRASAANNNWYGIAWSPELGLFAAVATSGTGNRVQTSPDGINWTIRASAADYSWVGIAWSPALGLFAAVASSGVVNSVQTSPDGINWTLRTSAANNNWSAIAWSPELGLFAAVAASGTGDCVQTSPDGINWTIRDSAANREWRAIAWSPALGLFAAVAASGTGDRVQTSPDGINWTIRASAANNNWSGIAWSPELGLFAAVASSGTGNRVQTSPDGINWTIRASAADYSWPGIAWSPELGLFAAVAYSNTNNTVMTSGSWTDVTADVLLGGDAGYTLTCHYGNWSTSPTDLVAQTGSLAWTMDNGSTNSAGLPGYYTPGHANCREGFKAGIQVRLSFYYSGSGYYKFLGYLKTVIPSPDPLENPVTECGAVDWFDYAARAKIKRIARATDQRFDQGAAILLNQIVQQPGQRNFQQGLEILPAVFDLDKDETDTILSLLGKVVRSEFGRVWIIGSMINYANGTVLSLFNRQGLITNAPAWTEISDMDGLEIDYGTDRQYNVVKVTIWPRLVDKSLIVLATQVTSGQYLSISPGETAKISLSFRDPNNSTRIGGTGVVMPVSGTDYKFGFEGDGFVNDLAASLAFTKTEIGGNTAYFEVKNNAAVTGYINLFQVRGYGVYSYDPLVCEKSDGLGDATLEFDMPYLQSKNEAQQICEYLFSKVNNPTIAIRSMKFSANKNGLLMQAALTGEPGTRWTIGNTQTNISGDWYVNGVEYVISGGLKLDVTWCCLPASDETYWVLDTSALDTSTRLAV